MQTTAWRVFACETLVKTVNEFEKATHDLRQIGCSVQVHLDRQGLRSGQTVWAGGVGPVQIAWEWTELQPDVVALFDPMSILCNVSLVDADGHLLARARRMLHLNQVVHRLPWREALPPRRSTKRGILVA